MVSTSSRVWELNQDVPNKLCSCEYIETSECLLRQASCHCCQSPRVTKTKSGLFPAIIMEKSVSTRLILEFVPVHLLESFTWSWLWDSSNIRKGPHTNMVPRNAWCLIHEDRCIDNDDNCFDTAAGWSHLMKSPHLISHRRTRHKAHASD